jgi:ABC-type hemin transport system ATPase subunit
VPAAARSAAPASSRSAAQYADRVAILENGRLAAIGPVDRVLEPEILSWTFATPILRPQAAGMTAFVSPAESHQGHDQV